MYEVRLVKSAIKDLSKISQKEALRISQKILLLKDDPRPQGCIKLSGSKDEYRIRIGNYRVLYVIEDKILLVEVIKIGDRKNIYG